MGGKEQLHGLIDRLDDEQETEAFAYLSRIAGGVDAPGLPARRPDDSETGLAIVSGRDFLSRPRTDWRALAAEQGVRPLGNLNELAGDFWPEDESVDDFIAAVREWRREGGCA